MTSRRLNLDLIVDPCSSRAEPPVILAEGSGARQTPSRSGLRAPLSPALTPKPNLSVPVPANRGVFSWFAPSSFVTAPVLFPTSRQSRVPLQGGWTVSQRSKNHGIPHKPQGPCRRPGTL